MTLPQFLVSKGENKDIKLFWCRLYMEGVLIQLQGQALCPSVEIYITKELEIWNAGSQINHGQIKNNTKIGFFHLKILKDQGWQPSIMLIQLLGITNVFGAAGLVTPLGWLLTLSKLSPSEITCHTLKHPFILVFHLSTSSFRMSLDFWKKKVKMTSMVVLLCETRTRKGKHTISLWSDRGFESSFRDKWNKQV